LKPCLVEIFYAHILIQHKKYCYVYQLMFVGQKMLNFVVQCNYFKSDVPPVQGYDQGDIYKGTLVQQILSKMDMCTVKVQYC
jgi:hypothetical protein